MTHPSLFFGWGGGGRLASTVIWFWSFSIWLFRLSISSFMLVMVSCRVWFWSIIACLPIRSSSILVVIISCINTLWVSMSVLNCSSNLLLSSSCSFCSSFIWKVKDSLPISSSFFFNVPNHVLNFEDNDTNLLFLSLSFFLYAFILLLNHRMERLVSNRKHLWILARVVHYSWIFASFPRGLAF